MRKMWTRLRLILSPGIISTTLAPVYLVLFVSFFMLRAVISEGDNDDDDDDKSDDDENGYCSTPTLMMMITLAHSAGCFLSPTL